MAQLYLSYANDRAKTTNGSSNHPYLEWLKDEARKTRRAFHKHKTVRCEIKENADLDEDIIDWLKDSGNSAALNVFGFSGHAGGGDFIFEDTAARCEGLAELLHENLCPGLKLVFLNGCLTYQALAAFEKSGIPIIITTTRSVDDAQAAVFGAAFFERLAQDATVGEAFRHAIAVIKTKDKDINPTQRHYRSMGRKEKSTGKLPPWQISYKEEYFMNWQLSMKGADPPRPDAPSKLFDLKEPPIDYAVTTINRREEWGRLLNFWDEYHEKYNFLQCFFDAKIADRPQLFIERFRRHLKTSYQCRVIDRQLEQSNNSKITAFGDLEEFLTQPKEVLLESQRRANPGDIIFLSFSIDLASATKNTVLKLEKLISGDLLRTLLHPEQKMVIFYHLSGSTLKKYSLKNLFTKKRPGDKVIKQLRRATEQSADTPCLWENQLTPVDMDDIHSWARKYTSKIYQIEKEVKASLGDKLSYPMSEIEYFFRELLDREYPYKAKNY
ncbi:hypothetical protein [Lewinella sp. LCG006]|uniref:hypothetical protein n=1 Tax=Lewinella sp. LCG006 TaxID=3231911 RepID=UPI00346120B5